MKKYVFGVVILTLSACTTTTHQKHAAMQETVVDTKAVVADRAVQTNQTDRIIREDVIIGGVLGGLVGAFLDADRGDRIHASEARYHRVCSQGNAYFSKATQTSDLEERITFMQEGIRYCPDNPAAHNDLGLGLMLWGDLPAARAQFTQALRLDSGYNPAWINLSRIQYKAKSGQKAGQGSNRGGGRQGAGLAPYRGNWERHYQNSAEALERRKRWSDRQKKLIKQNGGYD
jgi:Flp pilus assembly protein TadD